MSAGVTAGAVHASCASCVDADANQDGQISFEEAMAAGGKRFARFDRNKDGTVDKSDLEALRNEMVDYRVKRFMHRFGASQDGTLTKEQFAKFRNERFARYDYNSDGELSRDEMPKRHGRKWRRWKEWRGDHGDHHRGWHREQRREGRRRTAEGRSPVVMTGRPVGS